jgi:hypothetical protein
MPKIRSVTQWNSSTSTACNFRITASPEALSGFKTAGVDPYVTAG